MSKPIVVNIGRESKEIFGKFKSQVGSQHIASPVTIAVLSQICATEKPRRILEIGGGIGTVSYTLLKNSDAFVDIYEDNDFCINKLKENLAQFSGRFSIIDSYRILPPVQEYDLMIFDGGSGKIVDINDGGYKNMARLFINYLESVKTIYFEGRRRPQRIAVYKALVENYCFKSVTYSDASLPCVVYKGGVKIICKKSSNRLIRLASFVKAMDWSLLRKPLIYRVRRIKKIIGLDG